MTCRPRLGGSSRHNFLAGPNIIGQFKVAVDGQWAPYKQCNPIDDIADPAKPNGAFRRGPRCAFADHLLSSREDSRYRKERDLDSQSPPPPLRTPGYRRLRVRA